ncbi:MAG: hypothetical protein L6Q97_14900, partial [Thermoanaerobaculia bacterium]|nr:hypothetical protein [Thermoanaerobaculia bacterium]
NEMMTVCSVFNYVSGLVSSGNNTNPIFIRVVKDGACTSDAAGTPVWDSDCGISNSVIFDQVVSDVNNYPTGFLSGLVCIRPNPSVGSWHTLAQDCSPTNHCVGATEADLYSVVLHEALHVLGFASRIGLNGSPLSGDNYSRWDRFLYSTNQNAYLLRQTAALPCCDGHRFNTPMFPNMPNSLSGDCSMNVFFFDGTTNIAEVNNDELTPVSAFDMANKLSHLDNTCTAGAGFVMNPEINAGTSNRIITAAEQTIICRLGYSGSNCTNSCAIVTNDDGPFTLILAQGTTNTWNTSELVGNDELPTGWTISPCGSDPDITVTVNNNEFTVTGSEVGTFTFCYTVSGCQGWCDEAEVTVIVREEVIPLDCETPDCELVCFGDFEAFQPVFESYYLQTGLPISRFTGTTPGSGTPDVLRETDDNDNIVVSLGWSFNEPDINREIMLIPLAEPIQPNCNATIEFDAASRVTAGNIQVPTIQVYGMANLPCPLINAPDCGINPFPLCAGVEGYCLTTPSCGGNFGCAVPQDPNVIFSTGAGTAQNLDLNHFTLTWQNNTNQDITHIILFPGTSTGAMPNNGRFLLFVDNVSVRSDCNLEVTITADPDPLEICINGAGQTTVSVQLTGNVNAPVQVDLEVGPLPPGITIPGGGFNSNGQAQVTITPNGAPAQLNLQLHVAGNWAPGTTLHIPISATPSAGGNCLIFDGAELEINLVECAPFTCPCTGPDDLNIDAGNVSANPNDPGILPVSVHSTVIPNSTVSTFFSPNTLVRPCIAIKGNLVIDNNYSLFIFGGEIRMQPGARIIVAPGATLALAFINGGAGNEMGIHGCEEMWRSIEVRPGGTLYSGFNVIQDGEFAFDLRSAGGTTTTFTSYLNDFNRNHVGVRVNNAATATINQLTPFSRNRFRATAPLLPNFSNDITNWDQNFPYSGLHLTRTTFIVGTESDLASDNEFDGLRNGILADRTVLNVHYAKFLNIQGVLDYEEANPNFDNSRGIGIFARSCATFNVRNSTFDNGARGIHTQRSSLDIRTSVLRKLDAAIYNTPALTNRINIFDNDIYFRGSGIVVSGIGSLNRITIDRNDPIQTIPSVGFNSQAIQLLNGPTSNNILLKRVANNVIKL